MQSVRSIQLWWQVAAASLPDKWETKTKCPLETNYGKHFLDNGIICRKHDSMGRAIDTQTEEYDEQRDEMRREETHYQICNEATLGDGEALSRNLITHVHRTDSQRGPMSVNYMSFTCPTARPAAPPKMSQDIVCLCESVCKPGLWLMLCIP